MHIGGPKKIKGGGGAASHHYFRPPFGQEGGCSPKIAKMTLFGKIFRSRVGLGFATFLLNPSMIIGCNPILSELFTKRGLHLSVLELHPPTYPDQYMWLKK